MNKVLLIGNVGQDPEVRYVAEGYAVARIRLATTDRAYKAANGTEIPPRTEWHNVILWKGLAEVAEKYVHKGDKLFIEGKIVSSTYNDKNGTLRYRYDIYAENMEMLSPKNISAPASPSIPQKNATVPSGTSPETKGNVKTSGLDKEDLPF